MKTKEIAYVGLFTAITIVLSIVKIPLLITPIPITLQVLAVGVTGAVLGAKMGFLSMVIYTLLGLIGLPVFSGFTAGPGVLFGITGGYIFGFIAAAFVIGLIVDNVTTINRWLQYIIMLFSMLIGLIIIYAFGVIQMMIIAKLDMNTAIVSGVLPFIVPDIIKMVVGSLVAYFVRNALRKQNLLYRVQTS